MYKKVDLKYGNRVFGNGRVLLITTFDREKKRSNIASVAWNIVISRIPFMVGLVLDYHNYTYDLIKKEKEFVVNIPQYKMGNLVLECGKKSGRDCDKFIKFGIDAMDSESLVTPSLHGALAHLEFKFDSEIKINKSSLIIGKCINIRTLEDTFYNGMWNYKNEKVKFLHHIDDNCFNISKDIIKF